MGRRSISFAVAAALAVASVLSAPGGAASAASTFTFYGSGYGHGLGMSQWGSEGLAQMGWSAPKILTHFYRGTDVTTDPSLPAKVRIGLTDGRQKVHLTAQGGPVRVWVGAPKAGTLVGAIPKGATWTIAASDGDYLVKDGSGAVVGGQHWGSPAQDLFLTYADRGSRVFIPEADQIWGTGFAYGRGTIEFNLSACGGTTGCTERLIARLKLEQYLYGIGEVPASWPAAALQTQAVAARTYAVYALQHYGLRAACNCNLSDGSGDQTYIGWNREAGADGDRWVAAVDVTAHQIVTYNGATIQAFYTASDGGHTENVEDAWHGGDPAYAIPWLRGVCDPGEWTSGNSWTDWNRTFDAATLTARLAPYTGDIGTIAKMKSAVRGTSGRIITIVAKGDSGSATISGSELRAGLGLPDDRVWVNSDRNIVGAIRVRYDKARCAPGLPTSALRDVSGGAQQFFQTGGIYRNSAKDLTLWLKGVLDAEYRTVGAAKGTLGVPASAVLRLGSKALGCTRCKRVDFVGGRIYWKDGVGAHALWGPVLAAYLVEGGASGHLGFPTSRVNDASGGGSGATFEHGTISCDAGGSCTVTSG